MTQFEIRPQIIPKQINWHKNNKINIMKCYLIVLQLIAKQIHKK
jgi:hypothetical protein